MGQFARQNKHWQWTTRQARWKWWDSSSLAIMPLSTSYTMHRGHRESESLSVQATHNLPTKFPLWFHLPMLMYNGLHPQAPGHKNTHTYTHQAFNPFASEIGNPSISVSRASDQITSSFNVICKNQRTKSKKKKKKKCLSLELLRGFKKIQGFLKERSNKNTVVTHFNKENYLQGERGSNRKGSCS